jgi:hypothetical protein
VVPCVFGSCLLCCGCALVSFCKVAPMTVSMLGWRDRMGVPSKCTIVRAIGRTAYKLETTKESVVRAEVTLTAMHKTHQRKDCIPCP